MIRSMNGVAVAAFLLLPLGAGAQTVKYVHTDALGSVVAVTDASRNVIERREYEPYGAQLTPMVQDGPGYTGHVQDAATGLVYMQQRYYDPGLGVFLSTDPVGAYKQPIKQFHRYRYANANPYLFTDPDGRQAYKKMLLGNEIPIRVDESMEASTRAEIRGRLSRGISTLNNASLSSYERRVVQNVTSIQVNSNITRSFVDERSGALAFNAKELLDSSDAYAGSMIAHDGSHVEQYKVDVRLTGHHVDSLFNTRTLFGEEQALGFQLRVGEKIGISDGEKGYLHRLLGSPALLQERLDQQP